MDNISNRIHKKMRAQKDEHVFEWLENISMHGDICPLCDSAKGCGCYQDIPYSASAVCNNGTAYDSDRESTDSRMSSNQEDNSSTDSTHNYSLEVVKWDITGTDLILKAGGLLFPVHRAILPRYSSIFNSPLNYYNTLIIEMPAKARDVRMVLEYVYGFGVTLDQSNVSEILVISGSLDLYLLEEQCKQYLEVQLAASCKKSKIRRLIKRF